MNDELNATIAPFDRTTLDDDESPICAVADDLRIRYVNPAWKRFARDNGGPWDDERWLGTSFCDALPSCLRPFYERLFEQTLTTREPADHAYECSSATRFRRFVMRVFPTSANGLVMSHTRSLETPHAASDGPPIEALFRDANGIVTQCSHCRRHRRVDRTATQWDWIPAYVEARLPNTSHGLCAMCEVYFYPR